MTGAASWDPGGRAGLDAAEVKACCAVSYEGEWARLLLGESFHPGGLDLTRRLAELMRLSASDTVLDVACGRGTSAIMLAAEVGCRVLGVDLSDANVEAARAAAAAAGVSHLVTFEVGDSERLPVDGGSVDAVICECAFCTFPDKATATAEFARVLRPGGVLGITDLTRDGALPEALDSLLGWVACVADARPLAGYATLIEAAGLPVEVRESHDDTLRDLVKQVRLRLMAAEVATRLERLDLPIDQIREGQALARDAAGAIDAGVLGYGLLTARAPGGAPERG